MPRPSSSTIDLQWIESRCAKTEDGCWEYTGSIRSDGYAWLPRKTVFGDRYGHREVLQQVLGRKLDGRNECALHRCDNRKCLNPEHLFLGTYQDNAVDRESKGRGVGTKGKTWVMSPEARKKMSESAKKRHAREREEASPK
jgi:hypothetical protein